MIAKKQQDLADMREAAEKKRKGMVEEAMERKSKKKKMPASSVTLKASKKGALTAPVSELTAPQV